MLAHLHFGGSFPRQGWICGPEARAARVKSIDGSRITCGAFTVPPQRAAGEKGAPPGLLKCGIRNVEFGIPDFLFRIPHLKCPPGLGNDDCLMVLARAALASGPGMA